MRRQTQEILYHLLPVVFWLLAIGGIVLWIGITSVPFQVSLLLPAVLVSVVLAILYRIGRHTNAVEQCFQIAVLLGVAAYWLPSAVCLMLPAWVYLIYRTLFSFRAFCASLIGLALVAVWVLVLSRFSLLTFPSSLANNLFAWIPTGAVLIAWIASTIVRQNLRVR